MAKSVRALNYTPKGNAKCRVRLIRRQSSDCGDDDDYDDNIGSKHTMDSVEVGEGVLAQPGVYELITAAAKMGGINDSPERGKILARTKSIQMSVSVTSFMS